MITKCMEISTAHITEDTANKLGDVDTRGNITLSIYDKEEFGWWIFIDGCMNQNDSIPDDLLRCIQYAKEEGCDWLCLDCDGEIIDELPTYDWNDFRYYVTYKVDARYVVQVNAHSIEEAIEKSKSKFLDTDFGKAEDVDGDAVIVEDQNGDIVWER